MRINSQWEVKHWVFSINTKVKFWQIMEVGSILRDKNTTSTTFPVRNWKMEESKISIRWTTTTSFHTTSLDMHSTIKIFNLWLTTWIRLQEKVWRGHTTQCITICIFRWWTITFLSATLFSSSTTVGLTWCLKWKSGCVTTRARVIKWQKGWIMNQKEPNILIQFWILTNKRKNLETIPF